MAHQVTIPANPASAYDEGLRRFFLNVLIVMGLGLGITGAISLWISHDLGMMNSLFHLEQVVKDGKTVTQPTMSGWWWIATILQLGAVFVLSTSRAARLGKGLSYGIFFTYAGLTGVTLAPALFAYTDASVATTFFAAAVMFAGSALFGYTTNYNLQPFGTFFLMALIGLIVAMVMNLLFQAPAFGYLVSAVGVLLFAGLTAYDMQKLNMLYDDLGASDDLVVYGALSLYLDFINLFLFLLRFIGIKRN